MARQAKVSTGHRTADHMPGLSHETTTSMDVALDEALASPRREKPGRTFRSRHANFFLSLWATHDREINGERIRGATKNVQFQNNVAFVAEEDPDYARIIAKLEAHPSYRLSFWDQDELREEAIKGKIDALARQVRELTSTKEGLERLRQSVDAQEFVMLEQAGAITTPAA